VRDTSYFPLVAGSARRSLTRSKYRSRSSRAFDTIAGSIFAFG
jgi:hypothetical protein